ncbi:MAG TPA: hypothetical protein PK544_17310 [Spirochaetota bacterium]|nr:hypothetical protein [Spirochaetota bacterium]HPQ54356.1 hypothetical protein [Spirochaetota bacterium]
MDKENSPTNPPIRISLGEKGGKPSMTIMPAPFTKRLWNYLSAWYNVFPYMALGIGLTIFFGLEKRPGMVLTALLIGGPVILFLLLALFSYLRFGRGNAKNITLLCDGDNLFLTVRSKETSFPKKMVRLEYHGEGDHYNTEIRAFLRREGKKRLRLFRIIKLDTREDVPVIKKFCEKTGLHHKDARDYSRNSDTPAAAYM